MAQLSKSRQDCAKNLVQPLKSDKTGILRAAHNDPNPVSCPRVLYDEILLGHQAGSQNLAKNRAGCPALYVVP